MSFQLAPLPYAKDALEPHMSAETLDFHHGKHHNAYVVKLNELAPGTVYETLSLEDVVKQSYGKSDAVAIFNQAGQIYNHDFFWTSMAPNKADVIPAALEAALVETFGSIDQFKTDFINGGIGQFGSGWVWLVKTAEGKLAIVKTANADTPLAHGQTPLLVADVWEHAYYIDYRNRRPDFLRTFIDKLVNWEKVAERFAA